MSIISDIPTTILEGGRARADAILRAGQATAEGQARSGQAWGSLIGDLGQIGSQLPQQITEYKSKQAIESLMKSALQPNKDGVLTYNRDVLKNGLVKANMASKWPALSKQLDDADESTLRLKAGKNKLAEDTANTLGALAAGVYEGGNTPESLHAAAAHAIANQTVSAEEIQPYLDQVDADPSKVESITKSLMGASPSYKNYLSDRENRESQAEGRKASAASREAAGVLASQKASEEEAAKRLTNAAKQLSSAASMKDPAKAQAEYARRYAGLPADVQAQFDTPDQFDAKTTGQRALFVAMKPEDQLKALHDEVIDANRTAEIAVQRAREARLDKDAGGDKGAAKAATIAQKAAAEKWKADKLSDLEQAFKSSQSGTALDKNSQPIPVMTVAELNQAKAQIQQSYLAQIGLEPTAKSAVKSPPVEQPKAKTVTQAELAQIAKNKGTTPEAEADRAKQHGYTVSP